MKKIMIVFGTRPEAIKMAPLIIEFQKHPHCFETIVCVTGQHRSMLDQVLNIFEITTDYDLNIMRQGQDLFDVTSKVLLGMRGVLKEVQPDFVFVHGDTTTSTSAALAAFYEQIPVAHVEAGLRTYNVHSPWPEEMNRQLTSRIASFHFAPTLQSKKNLLNEGLNEGKIIVTGNTVIDALFLVIAKVRNNKGLENMLVSNIIAAGYDLTRLKNNKKLVLITGHRRENFGGGFINICNAINELAIKNPGVDFVYPMHLNPNVRNPIDSIFGGQRPRNIFFIEPQDYLTFVYLMERCYLILTDSGGIQEEAPSLGKPVLVMRDTTERPEAVVAGTVQIVGTGKKAIMDTVSLLINNKESYRKFSKSTNPYGDGFSSKRIVEYFMKNFI